ncbi:MAG: glutamate racemase [Gammaproteobacteria bacterium]|nr:glutamate racemase [Gammaproteobacteria bacterium]
MHFTQPIGVFDSGVGGLSVLREIRRELPQEDVLYVADSAHAPYGDKSNAFIEQRSIAISEFLLAHNAKAIVVACNTATSAAIAALRARFTVPIVGMEPAIKPAVAKTSSGIVGVLATVGTASSEKFSGLLARFNQHAQILVQPCSGLVEQVEIGELATAKTRALLQRYVAPLLARGADTMVLGCTHYPFLAPLLREIVGADIAILDPSSAVAREVRRRLQLSDLLSADVANGGERFWTSGSVATANRVIAQLWGSSVDVSPLS